MNAIDCAAAGRAGPWAGGRPHPWPMASGGTAPLLKAVRRIVLLACLQPWCSTAALSQVHDTDPLLIDPRTPVPAPAKPAREPPSAGKNFPANAVARAGRKDDRNYNDPTILSIPYGFYEDNFGAAVGYVYAKTNYPQRNSMVLGTLMAGTKGSVLGFVMGRNLPFPGNARMFVDPTMSAAYFGENDVYFDGNPIFQSPRPGINDSSKNNFVRGEGIDIDLRLKFKYVLPIGHGRDEIIPHYRFDRGLLVGGATGARSVNPLKSGRTTFSVTPFYRNLQVNGADIDETLKTAGFDFSAHWDNRDYPSNPTRGQAIALEFNLDPGLLDDRWDVIQLELEHYLDLGRSGRFRQRTIALDFWTAHSLSWKELASGEIINRPPAYTGATLGGQWRMRGYPTQRFNDRSAIYYSAELRLTPEWNPFDSSSWLQKHANVDWLQFAPFVEVGRVASKWSLSEFHKDMNFNAGLGIRARIRGVIARVDTAVSDEGVEIQLMIGMPFGNR